MVHYDHSAKNLIERIPSDSKIVLKEKYTGLKFYTTPYEISVANAAINKIFSNASPGYVSVLDVLITFGIQASQINDAPNLSGLLYGWNWFCFFGYDQPWITFWIGCEEEDGELIFTLLYDVDPCKEYGHCGGADCCFVKE